MKSFWSKRSERKELKQAAADRVRDEKLNSIILNSYIDENIKKNASKPYDVDYGNGSQTTKDIRFCGKDIQSVMVQLVENTELSSRKFVLNPANGIYIGSGIGENDIVVANSNLSEKQCEIFLVQQKVYIRNLGRPLRTIVKRKKEQTIIDDRGIRLLSGDKIILGNVTYDITIIL